MTKNRRHDIVKPSKFKTSLCSFFLTAEGCPFGDKCAFAHGETELRPEVAGAAEASEGAAATDSSTHRHGASTPNSPDPDHVRGAGAGHNQKSGKASTNNKRGPQTGIVLNNMARNVTAGAVNGSSSLSLSGSGGGQAGSLNTMPPPLPPPGAFFGSPMPNPAYAPYYAPPPGVSHVPFMALNNNQHPVNSAAGSVPVGFNGAGGPAYGMGMMPPMLASAMPPPPPPPPHTAHKHGPGPAHRVPVVSSNTIAPAGLHRHGMGQPQPQPQPLPPQRVSSYSPLPPSMTQGMFMLPLSSQGQRTPAPPLGASNASAFHSPSPPQQQQRTPLAAEPTTASTGAGALPRQVQLPSAATAAGPGQDGGALTFQSLMASAAPPTVVHIPLGAQQHGRLTPPSSVADAVGSWPSNAAATRYYMSQEPQLGEKNALLASLLQQVSGGSGAAGDGNNANSNERLGAAVGAAADADDDGVDWSAVLENWTRHQMQEDEAAAAASAAAAAAATGGERGQSPSTHTTETTPAPSSSLAVAATGPRAMPVVVSNVKPVMLALNKPVELVSTTATTATTEQTNVASATPNPADSAKKPKNLLCSVTRGAHTAGVPDADSVTLHPPGSSAEPDDHSVLLYNPQRNTVYYITHNSSGSGAADRVPVPPSARSHRDPVVDEAEVPPHASSSGVAQDDTAAGAAAVCGPGSTTSSQSDAGQSGRETATPKTDPLPPQSFRCRPGKKKFLVLGEEDTDDEAEYCI